MAFNPFDVFRRNQRILFAGLTVVIMLIFTLSFGQGDVISSIPRWLASGQRSGGVVAEVGGRKLYQSELADTQVRRSLANQYMSAAAIAALGNLRDAAQAAAPGASAATSQVVSAALAAQAQGYADPQLEQQDQFYRQFGVGSPVTQDQRAASRAAGIEATLARLDAAIRGAAGKESAEKDQTAALAAQRAIEVELRLGQSGRRENELHYFGNQPALDATARDAAELEASERRNAVEFRLWLRKADDLGIRFTDEDVQELAKKEFFQSLAKDDWAKAQSATVARRPELARELLAALGDEFRVRAAQGAVLGQAYLRPDARLYEAPIDFYRFYRAQTARGTFGVVGIPAANFVARVTGEPTEKQLSKVLDEGGGLDPNPASEKIGLREPRRLKFDFVEIPAETPFFKQAAADAEKLVPLLTKVGGFLAGPRLALTQLPVAFYPESLSDKAYRDYVTQHDQEAATYWFGGGSGTARVADTHLATPATLAATLAAAAGAPLSAAAAFTGGAFVADRQARLDTLPPALVLPLGGAGSNLAAAVQVVAAQVAATAPLAKTAVQARLDAEARTKLAGLVATGDVTKFAAEMEKLKAKSGDPAARAKVAEYAKSRGLTVKSSQEFRDLYSAYDDKDLAPLAAKFDEPRPFQQQLTPQQKRRAFGSQLFLKIDERSGQPVPAREFFAPAPLGGARVSLPATLVWRTEERAEERLRDRTAPATRAKLVAAWRRQEARKLAQVAAGEFAAKAQTLGADAVAIEQKLKDLKAQLESTFKPLAEPVRYFQIENVAPITEQVGLGGQNSVGGFSLSESENIEYPKREMVAKLLEAKEKSPSSSVTFADAPGDTVYVATLLYRVDPDAGQFATLVYGDSAAASRLAGPVRAAHQNDLRRQSRADAVALLKADYGYADKTPEAGPSKAESGE